MLLKYGKEYMWYKSSTALCLRLWLALGNDLTLTIKSINLQECGESNNSESIANTSRFQLIILKGLNLVKRLSRERLHILALALFHSSSRTSSARRNEESHVAFHSSQDTSSYSQQCEREGFGDVTKTPLNTPSTGWKKKAEALPLSGIKAKSFVSSHITEFYRYILPSFPFFPHSHSLINQTSHV